MVSRWGGAGQRERLGILWPGAGAYSSVPPPRKGRAERPRRRAWRCHALTPKVRRSWLTAPDGEATRGRFLTIAQRSVAATELCAPLAPSQSLQPELARLRREAQAQQRGPERNRRAWFSLHRGLQRVACCRDPAYSSPGPGRGSILQTPSLFWEECSCSLRAPVRGTAGQVAAVRRSCTC